MKTFTAGVHEVHPELIQILEEAVRQQPQQEKPLQIPLHSAREVKSLRQRLYSARKALLRAAYPNSTEMNKLEFGVNLENRALLIYVPRWLISVRDALKNAGVEPSPMEGLVDVDAALEQLPPSELVDDEEHVPQSSEEIRRLFGSGSKKP